MALPPFDDRGVLPPTDTGVPYPATLFEVRRRFVVEQASPPWRRQLFAVGRRRATGRICGGAALKSRRTLREIDADLAGARRYQDAYRDRPSSDRLIAMQERANDEEIVELLAERAAVLAAPEVRGGESTGAN